MKKILQQPIYSLYIRMIPESFFIMLSICLLTNTKVNYKNIAIASVIGGTCVYLTRLMPIHFGVHTILGVVISFLLAYKFNNIKINRAIVGTLVSIIFVFISDIMLFAIYKSVFKLPSEILLGKSPLAVASTLPSLIIFYIIVKFIVYFKRKNCKYE